MKLVLTWTTLLAGVVVAPQLAPAQTLANMSQWTAPARPGCPAVAWNVGRGDPAKGTGIVPINGILWYVDGSGISSLRGEGKPDGEFSLTATPVTGKPPSGTVTGRRNPDGTLDYKMVGEGCSNSSGHVAAGKTTTAQ